MASTLSHRWWALAPRGVVYILFGLTALLWPGPTFGILLTLFGIFALVDGAIALAGAARTGRKGEPWLALLLEGVVSAGVGVILPGSEFADGGVGLTALPRLSSSSWTRRASGSWTRNRARFSSAP